MDKFLVKRKSTTTIPKNLNVNQMQLRVRVRVNPNPNPHPRGTKRSCGQVNVAGEERWQREAG